MQTKNPRLRWAGLIALAGLSLGVLFLSTIVGNNDGRRRLRSSLVVKRPPLSERMVAGTAPGARLPVFRKAVDSPSSTASLAAVSSVAVAPVGVMSEGLAADLRRFDGDQLRAELQSIALSYPAVSIDKVACPGMPCRTQARSRDVDQLNQFVVMVTNRFQGHLTTAYARDTGDVVASLTIGTAELHPLQRYTRP